MEQLKRTAIEEYALRLILPAKRREKYRLRHTGLPPYSSFPD